MKLEKSAEKILNYCFILFGVGLAYAGLTGINDWEIFFRIFFMVFGVAFIFMGIYDVINLRKENTQNKFEFSSRR